MVVDLVDLAVLVKGANLTGVQNTGAFALSGSQRTSSSRRRNLQHQ